MSKLRKYGRYTRRKFLRDSALFSAGLAGLSLAGCTTTSAPTTTATTATTVATTRTPKEGGTMNMYRWASCKDYDTRTGDARTGPLVWGFVTQKLITPDPSGTFEKVLCEDYSANSDNTAFNFTLRDGITFHDDTDFTAHDIKDQMEVLVGIQEAPAKIRYRANFTDLESVDVDGDLEVTFNLSQPAFYYLDALGHYQTSYVVPSEYMTNTEHFAELIGTGPYTLNMDLYEATVTATLEKWDNYWNANSIEGYWKGPVYIDNVVETMVGEESVRWSALQSGDADIIDFRSADGYLNAVAQGGPYTFGAYDGDFYQRCIINLRNPPFDEVEFRGALLMGIDWDVFNATVFPGWGDRIYDIFINHPDFEYPDQDYIESLYPSYDQQGAADIVQDYDDDGKIRDVNILYDPSGFSGPAGEFFATEYAKIGLTCNLISRSGGDNKAFRLYNSYMPDDPEAEPLGWYDLLPGSGAYKGFSSPWNATFSLCDSEAGNVPEKDGRIGGYSGLNEPMVDAWIDESRSASIERRKEIYNDYQEYLIGINFHIPFVGEKHMWGYTQELMGLDEFAVSFRAHEFSMAGLWLDR